MVRSNELSRVTSPPPIFMYKDSIQDMTNKNLIDFFVTDEC